MNQKIKKIPSKKVQLKYLKQRLRLLKKRQEKLIKIYWEKIKDRPKYKDPNWILKD